MHHIAIGIILGGPNVTPGFYAPDIEGLQLF